ncbi:MAG: septum formation initiator family protein [Clostridia bacterium]|nr:septum formation initiator family protein [Clostridia bacterium]
MAAKTKEKVGFMRSRFMTVLLCGAIIWVLSVVWGQQSAIAGLKAEGEALNNQIAAQESERLHIENQMKTQDEMERVEQDARDMGMVKPNEVVFVDVSK